jgi:O-antigen ligase
MPALLLAFGAVLLAILLGAWGALAGWVGQAIVIGLVIPVLALALDYRLGLILCVMLLPYTNAPLLKGLGLFSVTNLLLLGTFLALLVKWILARIGSRHLEIPVPKPMALLYLLPIFIGMLIGTTHLEEIPRHLLEGEHGEWNARSYWVSHWGKNMLMACFSLALGACVLERGDGRALIKTFFVSATAFALVVFGIVASLGFPLGQLQGNRNFLWMTGRHTTEAGFLLASAITIVLFMRQYIAHKLARLGLLLMIVVLAVGMTLTFTRGAMLALAVVVVYYVIYFRRPMVLVGAVFVVALGIAAMPDAVRDRMVQGIDRQASAQAAIAGSGDDALTMGRAWVWDQLIREVPKAPAFGRGVLSIKWSDLVKSGQFVAVHTHNLYLSVLMDLGIVGALAFAAFYAWLWRTLGGLARNDNLQPLERGYFAGAQASLVAFMAFGIANGQYFPTPEQLYIWTAAGLAFGYQARLRGVAAKDPVGGSVHAMSRRGAVESGRSNAISG